MALETHPIYHQAWCVLKTWIGEISTVLHVLVLNRLKRNGSLDDVLCCGFFTPEQPKSVLSTKFGCFSWRPGSVVVSVLKVKALGSSCTANLWVLQTLKKATGWYLTCRLRNIYRVPNAFTGLIPLLNLQLVNCYFFVSNWQSRTLCPTWFVKAGTSSLFYRASE